MTERWLPVLDWEDRYEVSDRGRVRSLTRRTTDRLGRQRTEVSRVLSQFVQRTGYVEVILFRQDQRFARRVYRLVLEAFVGSRPDGLQGCHNDGAKTNNALSNLRWDTPSANSRDAIEHGVHPSASKTECKYGHEFTPENTQRNGRGDRICAQCARRRRQKSAHRTRFAADEKAADAG